MFPDQRSPDRPPFPFDQTRPEAASVGRYRLLPLGIRATDLGMVAISTGISDLDAALGCGGLPCGGIVEIYGGESSGKTTLALRVIAEAQRQGRVCAFIDADHSIDCGHARASDVDLDALLLCQPEYGEQAIEVALTLIRSGAVAIVCIDSAAALAPRRELAESLESESWRLQVKMMSTYVPRLASLLSDTKTVCVFTNQLRAQKAGVGDWSEATPGGGALPIHAAQRLRLHCGGMITRGNEAIASRVRVKVVKNAAGPVFRDAEFMIPFADEA